MTITGLVTMHLMYWFRGAQVFQKSRSSLKILVAKRVTWSKFHFEDPYILGTAIQNLITMALWQLEFVHPSTHQIPCCPLQQINFTLQWVPICIVSWSSCIYVTYLTIPDMHYFKCAQKPFVGFSTAKLRKITQFLFVTFVIVLLDKVCHNFNKCVCGWVSEWVSEWFVDSLFIYLIIYWSTDALACICIPEDHHRAVHWST
jgi:hypothetical protein